MRTINYNGRTIRTNLGDNFPFYDGKEKKTMFRFDVGFNETPEAVFRRLAQRGYDRITFYYVTTRVKGYYDLTVFAK